MTPGTSTMAWGWGRSGTMNGVCVLCADVKGVCMSGVCACVWGMCVCI